MENGSGVFTIPPGPCGKDFPSPAGHLLGSARILALTVQETVEAKIQEDLAGDRLSRSQWRLLEVFATTEVGNVTEVAAYQGVSTAAASKAVDRLVRLGLLNRSEDQEDRRHIRLSLSADGSSLARRYLERMEARLVEVFSGMDAQEQQMLSGLLDRLTAGVLRAAVNTSHVCVQCELNAHAECLMKGALHRECIFHSVHRPMGRSVLPAARSHLAESRGMNSAVGG